MRCRPTALAVLTVVAMAASAGLRAQDPDRDLPPRRVMMGAEACIERGLPMLAAGWSWVAAGMFREVVTQQPDRALGHLLLALAVREAPNHAARRAWDAVARLEHATGAERRIVEAYQRYFCVDAQPELKDPRFAAPPPRERAERLVAELVEIAGPDDTRDIPDLPPRRSVAAQLRDLEQARLAPRPPLTRSSAQGALHEQHAWTNPLCEMPFLVEGYVGVLGKALEGDPDRDLWLARVPRHPQLGVLDVAPAMPLPGLRMAPPHPHWQPQQAPGFDLPRGLGGRDSYARHAGKPLLVVFFLGFGCEHCVAQLVELDPKAAKFRAAGIEVVSIGTDDEDAVKAAHQVAIENGGDPLHFDVLCDPKAEAFRRWGVYDEFTKEALHGTFLVDAKGRILWKDVSVRPFDDSAWLLAECRRLLEAWK